MFPLKSLTRWWEFGLHFPDRSSDAYLPTNRREEERKNTIALSSPELGCGFSFVAVENKGSLGGISRW